MFGEIHNVLEFESLSKLKYIVAAKYLYRNVSQLLTIHKYFKKLVIYDNLLIKCIQILYVMLL